MKNKEKIMLKFLEKSGFDRNRPEITVYKTIKSLIGTSVPSIISFDDMIRFLNGLVDELEKERP